MKSYKSTLILLLCFFVLVFTVKLYRNYVFITPIHTNSSKKFGIIDGNLYNKHNNLKEYYSNKNYTVSCKQHGDYMLEFLQNVAPDVSLYYYNAETSGKISTEHIIEGLQWMLDSKVDCVAISLSSKRYAEELENWITQHKDKIKIYASYNNNWNSFDYPAQYEGVVGIGTEDTLNSKKEDILYRSYEIIVWCSKIKRYRGNSYLTSYTMIKIN